MKLLFTISLFAYSCADAQFKQVKNQKNEVVELVQMNSRLLRNDTAKGKQNKKDTVYTVHEEIFQQGIPVYGKDGKKVYRGTRWKRREVKKEKKA